jgi:glycosyltransferase involved in cell wall biosynthesis
MPFARMTGRRANEVPLTAAGAGPITQITVASGLRILHAIHDFLPRHQAGSEIYALELGRAQSARHHVTILCADYDPSRRHGHVTWRVHAGLPVVDIANNWICDSFADTYRSPRIGEQVRDVLDAVQPDVVHVHNLLNLTFELPAIARARRIPVVATLHDYTLVCASGGQRIHRADRHVCRTIDVDRCARCFRESPFHAQMSVGALAGASGAPRLVQAGVAALKRRFPLTAVRLARAAERTSVNPVAAADIAARLTAARAVFDGIHLFVAPSRSIASEFQRLGLDRSKIRVSDYGFVPLRPSVRTGRREQLRIGYVGTLVWHKGVHVLVDAVRGLPRDRYELKIFGNPDVFPDYSARLREESVDLPIRFMGAFSREQTAEIYREIDVLVVPSLWLENSPLVIHEAFMAGVPIVGARMGGIADLVKHGENGLLYEADSPSALAAALRTLIEDPCRLTEFTRRLPAVKSIVVDAHEWDALYEEVLERRVPVGAGR